MRVGSGDEYNKTNDQAEAIETLTLNKGQWIVQGVAVFAQTSEHWRWRRLTDSGDRARSLIVEPSKTTELVILWDKNNCNSIHCHCIVKVYFTISFKVDFEVEQTLL